MGSNPISGSRRSRDRNHRVSIAQAASEPVLGCRAMTALRTRAPRTSHARTTPLRRVLATFAVAGTWMFVAAGTAFAQTPVDPSQTPQENESATGPITPFGIHVSLATLLGLLGLGTVIFLVIMYMRYAPRFSKDEES